MFNANQAWAELGRLARAGALQSKFFIFSFFLK
jgi:hypothetical protein